MGLNSENAVLIGRPWLCFDIETCPMPDCREYLTDPVEAPSNYKDPAKIAAYVEEKRLKQIADAGLDLDLCEVAAIGWAFNGQLVDVPAYAQTRGTTPEAEMLDGFWRFVRNLQRDGGVLVGFNVLHFDLPILLRRSLYLGVPVPSIQIDKYRHDGVIDVADVLTFGGKTTWRSLGFYAKRFNLGLPEDPHDGAAIPGLVAAGNWDAVAAHVRSDVQTTTVLAQRIGLISQPQPADAVPEEAVA